MRAQSYLWWLAGALLVSAAAFFLLSTWIGGDRVAQRYTYVMERKTAARITEGKPVVMERDLDERELRWKIAERMPAAPVTAVLGSSHSLAVTTGILGGGPVMNFSISGGSVADHLITTEILAERKLQPSTWIVFVDVWFFDPTADNGFWRTHADELLRVETRLRTKMPAGFDEVFSAKARAFRAFDVRARYTFEPVLAALDGWLDETTLQAHIFTEADPAVSVVGTDGTITPASERLQMTSEDVRMLALRQFAQFADRHRYGNYGRIDENLWALFTAWLADCRQGGRRVVLVLPPYHPVIYPAVIADPANQMKAVEIRIRQLAAQTRMRVLGSFDPAKAGVTADDFRDGDHLREAGLEKLLAPWADR